MEQKKNEGSKDVSSSDGRVHAPTISLPKGGGAIRGIGEKFAANPVTGTGSMSVLIATSPGRGGFGPQLALSYDSGAGNGPFGLGWSLALPSITRKTDKGLPRYLDEQESDVFILAGAEDLVPIPGADGQPLTQTITVHGTQYRVRTYRPRIEGLFARIERWVQLGQPSNMFWRTLSRDNVTTWFGKSADSRIADPSDRTRIFQWFVCETHDDKGNVATYHYKQDDAANVVRASVEESNRIDPQRCANCYPDRILYGNVKPYLPALAATGAVWPGPNDVSSQHWMFEVVFDYTDPALVATPTTAPANTSNWLVRADPFSSHRAGFEVRTYRLCCRVLMFHHFEEELGAADYLVRSTGFDYAQPAALRNPEEPGYTVLKSVTQRAYQKRAPTDFDYVSRELPPVSFTYSKPVVDPTVHTIDANQLENLPVGTQGAGYQWLDLDGEGLSGVLTEQAGGWYYKPNRGDGEFGPLRMVSPQPAMALAAGSRHQFMDLAGNGEIDVVDFGGPTPGFHERDRNAGWKHHVPFASLPNIDWQDPNLRFVDLTGDGHADALITESEVFTWYPSLDERGFAASERTQPAADEDAGPRLIFADGTQTIFLADMCGDGLTDLVRIRNGEVCYWPNLGYGRFGRKITLGNSPRFDHPDLFDPNRIRLTDIDGSGPIDIIYLGRDGARLYFNRSGNSFSDGVTVALPIATENLGAVQVSDLLGNGTACLVWNSHLPGDSGHPVRYIDLMAGVRITAADRQAQRKHEKPHLLIKVDNNLGATTEIEYSPSTRFYLQDLKAGTPWVTRLPFPVHCVSKVTARDQWRGTAFSSTYSYHHGYFDGAEREFRGFGRVEQTDIENYGEFAAGNAGSPWITQDKTLYQPPIKTITWYHTGAAIDRERILTQFATEYFPQRYADRLSQQSGAFSERVLPEPELPADLVADEWREAMRACKGMVLRQEVYELDVDDLTGSSPKYTPVRLYSAATHNCHIARLQPKAGNRHAVFLVTESEAISYHYELAIPKGSTRLEPDPRIAHTLNLAIDEYGNILESAAAVYPRIGSHADAALAPDQLALINQVQKRERHLALNCTRYTQDINETHVRRLRMPCQTQTWEVTGINPAGQYFTLAELKGRNLSGNGTREISYHQVADGTPQKRLVECARNLFFADDLMTHRPFGQHGPLGLPYESYKLALTTNLLNSVYIDQVRIDAAVAALDAQVGNFPVSGYYKGSGLFAGHPITPESLENQYWVASGRAGFEDDAADHFYLPEKYTDPFGNETTLAYDGNYDLFIQSSTDAMGNTSGILVDGATGKLRFDYRVLAPIEMVDANGNRSEAVFDIRGLVVAAAVKGKQVNGNWEGDHLDGWTFEHINPSETAIAEFCLRRDFDATQEQQARAWLGTATTRFVYHFGESRDAVNRPAWLQRMAGACAFTREIHAGQPGGATSPLQVALECSDGSGSVLMKKVQAEPDPSLPAAQQKMRWIINGLTVLNNKGKPVKQYEPAFSDKFGCELPQAKGVTPIMYYDAAGRMVRTEMPDGTFSRVEFSPWYVRTFDANDTVKKSRWYAERLTATERGVPLPGPGNPLRAEALAAEALALSASTEDQRAARLAAAHADTPSQTHLDSLGREVIAIAHNRTQGVDDKYLTFTKLDAEGKPLWIRDACGNLVMQYITPAKPTRLADTLANPADPSDTVKEYVPADSVPCYDIAGNLLYQNSMDAGDRWMLMDAAGKPMLAWDANDKGEGTALKKRIYRTDYDALHRPTAQWLKIDAALPVLVEAFDYCDTVSPRDATAPISLTAAQIRNLIGQAVGHYDPSGKATVERIDLSGKPAHITRTLVKMASDPVLEPELMDWNPNRTPPPLEDETFIQLTVYDALGRMTTLYNWHRDITFASGRQQATPGETDRVAVYVPQYNQRGALVAEVLHVHAAKDTVGGKVGFTPSNEAKNNTKAIKAITYNEKGQKLTLELGNDTTTTYTYDDKSFRLKSLRTVRSGTSGLQNLHYTYDPVGNITHINDAAQATVFRNNSVIRPEHHYVYDALYRLIEGSGRENSQAPAPPNSSEGSWPHGPISTADVPRNYTQRYVYDKVGNFVEMQHYSPDNLSRWTRHYDPHLDSNRLNKTWYGSNTADAVTYRYDTHGSMLNLNRAPEDWGLDIRWDWRDMIRGFDCIGGGIARYHYGIDKQRTRKHITRNPAAGGTFTEDRIYLGDYELYRRKKKKADGSYEVVEEIESLHLFEGEQRVLLVDDVIKTNRKHANNTAYKEEPIYRYQYSNHLGSACLELDDAAEIISYEEYHPYGTSAYRAMKSGVEAPAKRYRYTGMERDEESGLGYHSSRFLHTAIGRWLSVDPIGVKGGLNLFAYSAGSPIVHADRSGKQPKITNVDLASTPESERTIIGSRATISDEAMDLRDRSPRFSEERSYWEAQRHSLADSEAMSEFRTERDRNAQMSWGVIGIAAAIMTSPFWIPRLPGLLRTAISPSGRMSMELAALINLSKQYESMVNSKEFNVGLEHLNLKTLAWDVGTAPIGNEAARAIFGQWKVFKWSNTILGGKIHNTEFIFPTPPRFAGVNWLNLLKAEGAFAAVSVTFSSIRSLVTDTPLTDNLIAGAKGFPAAAAQGLGSELFINSSLGTAIFPDQRDDPGFVAFGRAVSLVRSFLFAPPATQAKREPESKE